MNAAETLEHLKAGWMLVVNRASHTSAGGKVECLDNIAELTLSMDGEPDISLPVTIFNEISSHLSEPEHEHLCIFIYSLAE